MAEVYVYPGDCEDYTTIGLCGALTPTAVTFEEVLNGISEITLVHPLDRLGKYKYLVPDNVLTCEVPVRTTPEITEAGRIVTRVTTYTVKSTATVSERYIYDSAKKGRKMRLIDAGTQVTVVNAPVSGRWKVKAGKYSGYMEPSALDISTAETVTLPDTAAGIEAVAPAWKIRLQLFRIYSVEGNSEGHVTAKARHISYDMMYNITSWDYDGEYTLQGALNELKAHACDDLPFYFYTNIDGRRTGAHWADNDPITAILNPDAGMCKVWGAHLVRDNNELFLLDNAGIDRGVTLEYCNNITGVTMSTDMASMCTRIRPIGENKDGSKLYLDESLYPGGCVDSPLKDTYAVSRMMILTVDDAKVDGDVTVDIARARMIQAANAKFDEGVDKPSISVSVQFAFLGDTARYASFKALGGVFLADTVNVYYPPLDINVTVSVSRIMWDVLRERMISAELGDLQALAPSVSGWQISGGITGGKVVSGSIGAGQLAGDAISSRHIQAESINADKIQAGAVTAEKINAAELKAQGAQIDDLKAAFAEINAAYIEKLNAGSISADRLAAAMAQFEVIAAGSADFDRATIKHLVSSALNIQDAVGDKVFISNLMVDYANMVNAYVGNLCIKAADGYFYKLNVNPDGTVSAERTTATEAEQAAGQKTTGEPIIETSLTVSDLSATSLKAVYALVNKLDAARIDVGTLTAGTAFVNYLRTADIAANRSIQFALAAIDENSGSLSEIRRYMTFSDSGLVQRVPDSSYYTRVTNSGFDVMFDKQASPVVSVNADDGLAADRILMGNITCRKTSAGGWVWQAIN